MKGNLVWNRSAALFLAGVFCVVVSRASAQSLRMVPETGHFNSVTSASFSPDGQRIVTASDDHTAKVWDAATGKELLTLTGHVDSVTSASFSPDGKRIVTASEDETAKVWDAATGKEVVTLTGHSSWVESASFSPDGKRIVTASADNTAKVWDAATGKELITLTGHSYWVTSASFSPDGKRIVTASDDRTAKVWDAATGNVLATLTGHPEDVNSASFSPDGKRIVTASADNTARVWDAATGEGLLSLKGHSARVTSASFSPDGKRIVTASWDNTARVWDAATGKDVITLSGHSDGVQSASFSPDGLRIVTGSRDLRAKVWDAATGKQLVTLTGHSTGNSASLSPDGKRIVTGSRDNTAKVRDAATGRVLLTLTGHSSIVTSAWFSPDGKEIVTESDDFTVRVWDADTGKELATLRHSYYISSVRFSPDGKRIVTASLDGTAKVWDAATGKVLATLLNKTGDAEDPPPANQLDFFTGRVGGVTFASFSPDGERIVTAAWDRKAKVWDAATGKLLVILIGHTDTVESAAFSQDGMRIVTVSSDRTAKVWDATGGKMLLTLSGLSIWVNSASFSPDGKQILTLAETSTEVWDGDSGRRLYTRFGFDNGSWIVLAPDGRYDSSEGPEPRYGHFVMEVPHDLPEVIGFDQIRTKDYYERGLVNEIVTGIYKSGEHPLLSQKLAPRVEQSLVGNVLKFRVTERFGGGIGEVRIIVGGQAVKKFAKGSVASGTWISWDGKGIIAPGLPIDVNADNGEETIASPRGVIANLANPASAPIRFVGVAMGVKDYLGDVTKLKYAGADAVSVTRAMLALATSVNAKSDLFLLTDEAIPDDLRGKVTVLPPTKASYNQVYSQLKATKFDSSTLLFLDFSGHGVVVGDQYVYLTQDARSADPKELQSQLANDVTMSEILDFLKLGLASKRLLVLDTCQAGGAERTLAANLRLGETESKAEGKTIADWKKRYAVGTQVLMGCPEGAASFEDPRYGHGLLTYSLLYCLRNSDLGPNPGDPEVLADQLVRASASRTEAVARDLGLNQFPLPLIANSFPIGMMTKDARQTAILLPDPKPAIGSCSVEDANYFRVDSFNHGFIESLEGSSKSGTLVHIVSELAPGVWTLTGQYLKGADGKVTLKLRLACPGHNPGILPDIITTESAAVDQGYHAVSKWLETNAASSLIAPEH